MAESMLSADKDDRIIVELSVNGSEHRMRVAPHATLLDVLRQELRLTGTRDSCGIGVCGACTVLVDERPMSACLLLAFQVQGSRILTVEGLSANGGDNLDPVQRAFAETTAFQCGYCTPGFLLATHALLREHPNADARLAREYLSGNLCRCGSYVKILTAVLSLGERDVE